MFEIEATWNEKINKLIYFRCGKKKEVCYTLNKIFAVSLKVFKRSGIIFYIIRSHNKHNKHNNDEQQINCRTTSIEKVEEKQTEINTT